VPGEPVSENLNAGSPSQWCGRVAPTAAVLGVLRVQADDIPGLISDEMTLAVVEKDELIFPRIHNHGAPSDRDVKRLHHDPAASSYESLNRRSHLLNGKVDFRSRTLSLENTLPICVRKSKAGGGGSPPHDFLTKRVVEPKSCIQVSHVKCKAIDLANEWSIAHLVTVRRPERRTSRSARLAR
jgi:hypothetical protein